MNGIAHRDVPLENVLLRDGVCNIPDFGFATYVGYLCTEVVGKNYYMTPEVAAGERYAPIPADMWPLGILLFVILTGSPLVQRAVDRNNEFAAFCQLEVHRVVQAWKMASFVSERAYDHMAALLECDPAKRLATSEVLVHPLL